MPIKKSSYKYRQLIKKTHHLKSNAVKFRNKGKKLRESIQFYNELIENSTEGIVVFDCDLKIVSWNLYMEKLTGFSADEVLNKSVLDLFPLLRDDGVDVLLKKALNGQMVLSTDIHYDIPETEKTGWVAATFRPRRDSSKNIQGVVGMIHEITDWKNSEQILKKQTIELDERIKELNCMFWISKLRENPDLAFDEILQGIVDILPPSWQHPDLTCARLIIKGLEFKSNNFRKTSCQISSDIIVNGEKMGILEVYHFGEIPNTDKEPFLKEQILLLDAVAERIGKIVEHKLAEETINESEKRFQSIIDNSTALISLKNLWGRYILINSRFEQIYNVTNNQIEGKTDHDIFPKELADSFREQDHKVIDKNTAIEFEEIISFKNHDLTYISIIFPLQDSSGNTYGVCRISTDISARKKIEDELKKAHDDMEKRVKERTSELQKSNEHLNLEIEERKRAENELHKSSEKIKMFAYSVSHDLKSPAIGIYGLTKRLHNNYRNVLDNKGQYICDQILKASESIVYLVEMINIYISSKETPIKIEMSKPCEILQMVHDEFSLKINIRQITWEQPETLPEIRLDRLGILRVFRNIIDNALKYGGENLSILRIGYKEEADFHIFSVTDNGIGITGENSEKVFELFQRHQSSTGVDGTGMGLAIVKEIVEKHGGRVWINSGQKSGITFSFSINKNLDDSPSR